ncbi:outer membrane protein assembly factor BamD [Parazoarcus communis]|uniref:Outer membrane protein assembly factor BamD n=1 Tax=Parazoarcus communis TaxID=41977 RepID=A0A2U8GKF1_9RHOO|nr:outer membrane protein assembly factor BamD [Parazoarcus communis]AWI73848.1 outer membrane protein assembly factor BamD [Parazoarcus communis]TVT54324.1 MAG: outer membrane protein assembly factor BamD [Azoarcus sp. PHD]|tara:strand:- start:264182 stop:264991 length:810 start_codon:yes stop_codon:yes gene_type:complete
MSRFTFGSLAGNAALIGALLLGGCGLLPEQIDETAGWSAQKLYSEAKASMSEGGYDQAIKMFEKLEARYPYGRFAQQAQIESAYAYYKSNESALALAAADRFIKLHPNHPNVDYVYYLKGLVNFNEDLGIFAGFSNQDMSERDPRGAREAFDTFNDLVTRFPESRYAEDARQRMQYLVNALASHEVHVARYYYNRGAYIAAANRAQAAITTYPRAPANEEALFLMVKSYDALGMTDLRDDANRVMRKNFPNSVYYSGGPADDRPWWQLW